MENEKQKKIIFALIPIVIALLSFFVIARFTSSTEFNAKTIQSLDDKKTTVMELAAASTAASAAITLIPGDVGTPIANKLADLSSYFMIPISAIYLEKYLVTITGYAAFKILVPIACVFFSGYLLWRKEILRVVAQKFLLFGLAVYLVIPASVKVADMIETTYASSIESTIETAKQTTDEIESETGESGQVDDKSSNEKSQSDSDSDSKENAGGFFSGLFNKVQEGVSTATANVKNVLNNFIEALAILLVTSCLIPILVLIFFVWLVKMLLGLNIDIPTSVRK